MIRTFKHIRTLNSFLSTLHIDNLNLTIRASREGWDEELQKSIVNNALLIRKYERRLKLIKM
jgi:radical SAM superfamily enzyme with C-terminal helix-hairpin-helix motif